MRDQTLSPLSEDSYIQDLADFISASPSSFHAAQQVAQRLEQAGFSRLDEEESWGPEVADGRHFVVRDGAILAWLGTRQHRGYRILGAHTDSPSFKVKPQASQATATWQKIGVEVYGGPLLNSWLDRELRLAGRLTFLREGQLQTALVATGPLARIPQLAIHLDREANNGLKLDKQANLYPVWGFAESEQDLLDFLARQVEGGPLDSEAIVGYDLVFADSQEPRRLGARGELFAAGRLDNLSSVHAGLQALLRCAEQPASDREQTLMLAAFDHEEIGSESRSGACGPFLEDILVRLSQARGETPEDYRSSLARSVCLSSDAGHLLHPNYPGHHDPAVQPQPGGGPLLKINANQCYATDAVGAGIFAQACALAGVPYQTFVSNNNVPCGSTIGPLTATRLGMRTVDVGVGLLSMHSARELTTVDDMVYLTRAIEGFYSL